LGPIEKVISTISSKGTINAYKSAFKKYLTIIYDIPEEKAKYLTFADIEALAIRYFSEDRDRVEHIRKPRFIDPTNNKIVERLNGTIREREKVMRGMKNDDTAEELMNGFRAYYNFIRPHMGLNGKTPAEESGLNLGLGGTDG